MTLVEQLQALGIDPTGGTSGESYEVLFLDDTGQEIIWRVHLSIEPGDPPVATLDVRDPLDIVTVSSGVLSLDLSEARRLLFSGVVDGKITDGWLTSASFDPAGPYAWSATVGGQPTHGTLELQEKDDDVFECYERTAERGCKIWVKKCVCFQQSGDYWADDECGPPDDLTNCNEGNPCRDPERGGGACLVEYVVCAGGAGIPPLWVGSNLGGCLALRRLFSSRTKAGKRSGNAGSFPP